MMNTIGFLNFQMPFEAGLRVIPGLNSTYLECYDKCTE
jgi:hypothetical protein